LTPDTINAAYQHHWNDVWRSNFVVSHMTSDYGSQRKTVKNNDNAFKKLNYAAWNIIWSPNKNVSIAFENILGHKKELNGDTGNSTRFLLGTRVHF